MLKKRIREIVAKAADELGLPKDAALTAYRGYWLFLKEKIEGMPLEGTSEEVFKTLRTSVNVPGLGKFFTSFKRVQKIDKAKEIINERAKNKGRKTIT